MATNWRRSQLIGRKVYIPDQNGRQSGDWGTVIGYDGEYYHIAFADDKDSVLVFKRSEIHVRRCG